MRQKFRTNRVIDLDAPSGLNGTDTNAAGSRQSQSGVIYESRPRPPIVDLHSSEISTRFFPKKWAGIDPTSVREWLLVVEPSFAALEDEVLRLRDSWDEILIAASRARAALGRSIEREDQNVWRALARALVSVRPPMGVPVLHASSTRAAFSGRLRRKKDLQAALEASNTQLARLQRTAALLERSNEQLRTQLIDSLVVGHESG